MSPDVDFLPLAIPALNRTAQDDTEARARARGHATGFAAGAREAREAAKRDEARREIHHAQALHTAEETLRQRIAAVESVARALREKTVPLVAEAENVLAASAIELAEAILGHELARADGGGRAALDRVLGAPGVPLDAVVRLNPADLDRLDPDLLGGIPLTLVADPELAPGDAVAEFADGSLDARIGSALARAKAALGAGA